MKFGIQRNNEITANSLQSQFFRKAVVIFSCYKKWALHKLQEYFVTQFTCPFSVCILSCLKKNSKSKTLLLLHQARYYIVSFCLVGSKCTWMWDSVAEKSASWKNCSVLRLLERLTRKNTFYIHGIHAWGKQESRSTSSIVSTQCDEHLSRQRLQKCTQILMACPGWKQ